MSDAYAFLVDTYATEIQKTLQVWSQVDAADLRTRPRAGDRRGRTLLEHMVHQCQSENGWFEGMFGIRTTTPPLPAGDDRAAFLRTYAACAAERLAALRRQDDAFWRTEVSFFGSPRSRAWVMVRRIAHTAHHRGQQTQLLRQFGRALYSVYGPTADTGGLGRDQAPVIYAYPDTAALLQAATGGGGKAALPPLPARPVTERPDA